MRKHMRKFRFEKLVRDKIVPLAKKGGDIPHLKKLSKRDYIRELKKKLIEEVQEVGRDKDELLDEVADIQEILDALIKALDSSKKIITAKQKKKNAKNGAFKKQYYIKYMEVSDKSRWLNYYLKNLDKYPEIK